MSAKPATATNQPISQLTFEEALSELEQIVRKLEDGQQKLDSAIEDYTRGTALKDHCLKTLADAKLKVEKIMKQSDGTLRSAPLDDAS